MRIDCSPVVRKTHVITCGSQHIDRIPTTAVGSEEIVEGSVEAELLSAEEGTIKESGGSTISWWAIRVGIILKPLDKDIRGVNIKEHPNGALEIRISHLQLEEATLADIVDLKWVLLLLGEGISEGDIVPWIQCQRLAAGPTVSDSTHEDPTEIEWPCSQGVAGGRHEEFKLGVSISHKAHFDLEKLTVARIYKEAVSSLEVIEVGLDLLFYDHESLRPMLVLVHVDHHPVDRGATLQE